MKKLCKAQVGKAVKEVKSSAVHAGRAVIAVDKAGKNLGKKMYKGTKKAALTYGAGVAGGLKGLTSGAARGAKKQWNKK